MVKIVEAVTSAQMRAFARYPLELYKDCDYYVPCFTSDEKNIKNPKKNYAAEGCEVKCFLAEKNGKIVGRIAGVIVSESNRKFGEKKIRFSRFDFNGDEDVAEALLNKVAEFGKERGMTVIHGPWGFNDTDREGMLTSGFDRPATYATNYNYEYYADVVRKLGFKKESEWVEFAIYPGTLDPKIYKAADFVQKRYGFVELNDKYPIKRIIREYGDLFFDCYNEAYKDLDCYVELKGKVKQNVITQFATVINQDYFSCILDPKTGKIAAFGVVIPAIGKIIKKHNGNLLASAIPLLKAKKKPDALELTLIGVAPEYRNSGVNAMIITRIHRNIMKNGIKNVVCNPMLTTNAGILTQWKWVEHEEIKRRATFEKEISQ
mgnify:FL=1